jgi:hypothetical protein
VCPIDFIEALRSKSSDDQLSLVIVHKEAVSVLNGEGSRPSRKIGHFLTLPNAFACIELQTTQLTIAADSIDVLTLDYGRGD